MPKVFLTKRVTFSALHALYSPRLSDEENLRIFGKCFRTHGHDYFLEVCVTGSIDPISGLCIDRDFFDEVLEREVRQKFNGRHLNECFKSTTGEELAKEFYEILEKFIPQLISVRLEETPRNFFVYWKTLGNESRML